MGNGLKEKKEKELFEKLVKETLKKYFDQNFGCLIKGNIRIEEKGDVVRIYRKCSKDGKYEYDIGVVG